MLAKGVQKGNAHSGNNCIDGNCAPKCLQRTLDLLCAKVLADNGTGSILQGVGNTSYATGNVVGYTQRAGGIVAVVHCQGVDNYLAHAKHKPSKENWEGQFDKGFEKWLLEVDVFGRVAEDVVASAQHHYCVEGNRQVCAQRCNGNHNGGAVPNFDKNKR